MRKMTIGLLANILSGIKINRVPGREAKGALMKDYLAFRKIATKADADKNEIVRKFQADWADELEDVEAQREANRKNGTDLPIHGHDAYLEAEDVALDAIALIDEEDVEVQVAKVKAELLYDPDLWPDDVTLGQIPGTIEFLIANGVAED